MMSVSSQLVIQAHFLGLCAHRRRENAVKTSALQTGEQRSRNEREKVLEGSSLRCGMAYMIRVNLDSFA